LDLFILLQQGGIMHNAQVNNRVNRAPPGASRVQNNLHGFRPCSSSSASSQGVASAYLPVGNELQIHANVGEMCVNHRVGYLLRKNRLTVCQIGTNNGMQPYWRDAL